MANANKKLLSAQQTGDILSTLKARFEKNPGRHEGVDWRKIQEKLEANPEKLWSLNEMEITGGEPDVVTQENAKGEFIFYDCAPESPIGRRSICFDRHALESRKENKPKNSAMEMADAMGIKILSEREYRELQQLGKFDTKTSSWVETPDEVRKLGGALFADFRYGRFFIYHNGAESYYAGRGFRGSLRI